MTNASTKYRSLTQELTEGEFGRLAAIAREDAGLMLPESKRQMVQSRMSRHLKRSHFESFDAYISHVERDKGGRDREELISLLTTNVSSFFREDHHFKTLETQVLPSLISDARRGSRVRIWSAGCSTGQEPYTIAMKALMMADDLGRLDFKILATDIDPNVLNTALAAIYPATETDSMPEPFRTRFITPATGAPNHIAVEQSVRDMVSFRKLNLISDWPMRGQFDVIFCRNVVIYFDDEVQASLWPRFASALKPDGWFFLGHSERLGPSAENLFESAGVTTYRRRLVAKGAA